jgi:hypothetical protein
VLVVLETGRHHAGLRGVDARRDDPLPRAVGPVVARDGLRRLRRGSAVIVDEDPAPVSCVAGLSGRRGSMAANASSFAAAGQPRFSTKSKWLKGIRRAG